MYFAGLLSKYVQWQLVLFSDRFILFFSLCNLISVHRNLTDSS